MNFGSKSKSMLKEAVSGTLTKKLHTYKYTQMIKSYFLNMIESD